MTSDSRRLRWFNGLKLHWKLAMAFLAMAPLIAAAGGAGIVFINQISGSVDTIARVSAPMVHEATTLVRHADGLQRALADALIERSLERVRAAQQSVDAQSRAMADGFQKLRDLAQQGGVEIDVAEAESLGNLVMRQARDLISSLNGSVEASARLRTGSAAFEGVMEELAAAASQLAAQSESLMTSHEDGSRTLVQSGSASMGQLENVLSETFTETYPVLRSAYRLQAYVAELRDEAQRYMNEDKVGNLDQLEKDFESLLKGAKERQKKLQARASGDITKLAEEIGTKLGEIEKITLVEGGLFGIHRESVTAALKAQVLNGAVRGSFAEFETSLQNVFSSSQSRNDTAMSEARDSESTALMSTGVIVMIGIGVSLLYGAFSARSV
ncbi:MAG: hypothetical protein ACREEV_05120, partial [Dongiaceae bacterium]